MVQNWSVGTQTGRVGDGIAEKDELEVEGISIDEDDGLTDEDDGSTDGDGVPTDGDGVPTDEDVRDGVAEDVRDGVAEDDTVSRMNDDVEDSFTEVELVTTETVSPAEPVVQVVVVDDTTLDEGEIDELERVDCLLDEDTALQLPKPSWQRSPQ
jgi:hypothetical protein